MDKFTIASRATHATGRKFYKSYVKNIKLADARPIPNHKAGNVEYDYFFDYKGVRYRVNEHICPNDRGEVIYSEKYKYTLEMIDGDLQ